MKKFLLLLLPVLLLSSCASTPSVTRGAQYAKLYEEKPVSIVVMPPINQTNFVEAKDYFYTTMYMPLCEKGYYVYSPNLMLSVLQEQSAYDSEMFLTADLGMFYKALGADAAMFTIIKSWSRSKIGGTLTADVEYILRSTKSGETLYQREGEITVDTSVNAGSSNSLFNLIATAVVTAATDKVVAGRRCTSYVLSDMPEGKYGTYYGKDQEFQAGKSFVRATVK